MSAMIIGVFLYLTKPKEEDKTRGGLTKVFQTIIENTDETQREKIVKNIEFATLQDPFFKVRSFSSEIALRNFLKKEELLDEQIIDQLTNKNEYKAKGLQIIREPVTKKYITFSFNPPKGPGPKIHPVILTAFVVVFVVILTSLLSSLITYRSFEKFYANARDVIDSIKNGDLNARFTIARDDEIGKSMFAFNEMAEEVEKYVNKIKASESNRINLLQELAHDLRTPIASLKSTIGVLSEKRDKMTNEQQKEFFNLSELEIHYFEKLVEDLLFLAKMSEPKYEVEREKIEVCQLIEDEINHLKTTNSSMNFELKTPQQSIYINGDKHLIHRLFKNAYNNAISFSKGNIKTSIGVEENHVIIIIEDDGSGFSKAALESFGKRKVSRSISQDKEGQRVSIGLGSVIMKNIAGLHSGDIKALNGGNGGAKLIISLKTLI